MANEEDGFGGEAVEDPALEAYERDRDGLHEVITDYLEEFDIGPGSAVLMLLELVMGLRLEAYGFGVENPSVSGLKLDLDRLGRDVAEMVRESKKNAEELLGHIKQARADAEAEDLEERAGGEEEDEEDLEESDEKKPS